jgi:DNA-binding PadR family transcriptional regulator
MQSVEAPSGMAMGPGTIYGTLERLEGSGFVKELPAARRDRWRTFALQPAQAGDFSPDAIGRGSSKIRKSDG